MPGLSEPQPQSRRVHEPQPLADEARTSVPEATAPATLDRYKFSTTGLAIGRRVTAFREAVCDAYYDVDLLSLSAGPHEANLSTVATAVGRFSWVQSDPCELVRGPRRPSDPGDDFVIFSLQSKQRGFLSLQGDEYVVGEGEIACYSSSRPYRFANHDRFEAFTLMTPAEALWSRFGLELRALPRLISGASPAGAMAANFLRDFLRNGPLLPPETAERMFAIAMELICTAAQAEAPDGQLANARYGRAALVRRARAIIDDRLADSELSTETVAALVGISPRYLQSVFRSEGSTVAGTIWRRRLDRARRMLDNPMLSGDPVSDVAFSCGFTSAAHFSQKFKSRFHISPRDYRRARRSQR